MCFIGRRFHFCADPRESQPLQRNKLTWMLLPATMKLVSFVAVATAIHTSRSLWELTQSDTDAAMKRHEDPPQLKNISNIFGTSAPTTSSGETAAPSIAAPGAAPVSAPVVSPTQATPAPSGGEVPPVGSPISGPSGSPIQAPVAAPAGTSVPAPVQAPVAAPGETSVPAPVQAPVASPAAAPVQAPVAAPGETSVPAPVQAPVASPAATSVPAPVEAPVAAPGETSVPTPGEAPVEAPVGGPTAQGTLEEFLTATLTDDGSLTDPSTPQNAAYLKLQETNPDLDPSVELEQQEIIQRYVLNTFYFALNGSEWQNIDTSLWTTAAPICAADSSWPGVGCDGETVISLEFNGNALAGVLPSEIQGLSNLCE